MSDDIIISKQKGCTLTLYESLAVGSHSQVFSGQLTLPPKCYKVAAKKVRLTTMESVMISSLTKLNHKNIIKFHGVYAFNELKTFIVMENAENGDLYHFLMRYRIFKERSEELSRLPNDLVWSWVFEAASAIQYLHAQSQIHRDIKSQNFLISGSYILKLGDLGMARKMDTTSPTEGSGTFGWMAPEVIKTQRRSRKSDVFSFGIVAWEICSTEVPFSNVKGDFKVMQKVCDGARPCIADDCPEKMANILKECWEQDYNRRPEMDSVVVKLLPHQTDTDIPRLVEHTMKEVELKAVIPPSSVTSLEPDGKDDTSFDRILNDKYLLELAGQLGSEWEQLGTYLEFKSSDIFRIKSENSGNMLSAIHKMLICWRQQQNPEHGVKQIVENLSQALGSCRRKDLAQRVLHLIPKKPDNHN